MLKFWVYLDISIASLVGALFTIGYMDVVVHTIMHYFTNFSGIAQITRMLSVRVAT